MSKSRNSSSALHKSNQAADTLLKKLERIKALLVEIPSAEDLDEINNKAAAIASSLNEVQEFYGAKDFPGADDFDDLDKKLNGIVGNLNEIAEKQEDVAVADDYDDLDKRLDGIVGKGIELDGKLIRQFPVPRSTGASKTAATSA